MPAGFRRLWPAALVAMLSAGAADAGDASAVTAGGVVIATYQHASDPAIAHEGSGAADVSVSVPAAGGAFEVEFKGATSPRAGGVTSGLSVANASVGETLDADDHGRIVAWQLFYRHDVGNGSLAAGLIDAAAWIDGNDVANDEFSQFMGVTFVNNPTVDLPAASAGVACNMGLAGSWGLAALAMNATGVEPRYRRAFDLGQHGNGAFTALEAQWSGSTVTGNLGAWLNTRHHDTDGDGIDDDRLGKGHAYGVYGNLSGSLGAGKWNLRAGWAAPRVQSAAGFLGLAYSYPLLRTVLGAGVSRTFASSRLAGPRADLTQAEIYGRLRFTKSLTVTADLQHIAHDGFDPAQRGTWVTGMRVGWSF
ncbi:MAG: hypothetical protein P8076_04295 [Gammaproteobacteria bacterium]